ncbi:major capsid protein [Dipodfec virus UOA04_Rod_985]|nr:major capsid protein [Dipodfec virus UOA04_Rod_985]
MKKSKFNLSHLHSTTLDAGYLVPVFLQETLPNDSFKIGFQSFIRCQPMLAPLMHKVPFYLQYWYVPYRILWTEWTDFITGGENLDSAPAFPVVVAPEKGWQPGSLADYLGFPINQGGIEVSAMPFRAIAEIWNTRYRDEDLQNDIPVSYDSGLDTYTHTSLLSPSWKRDYFTTARSTTQRGSQISVPITGLAGGESIQRYSGWNLPVYFVANDTGVNLPVAMKAQGVSIQDVSSITPGRSFDFIVQDIISDSATSTFTIVGNVDIGSGSMKTIRVEMNPQTVKQGNSWYKGIEQLPFSEFPVPAPNFSGVYCRVTAVSGNPANDFDVWLLTNSSSIGSIYSPFRLPTSVPLSGGFEIRDLRLASSLQRYQENSLKWGNRYEEFIQREFHIKPRDSRIQRPEYLGGSKSVLQISEVLQTAEGTDSGVGTMRGHGVSSMSQRPIRFTAPEHGLIIGFLSVRPEPVYTQGIHREWLKRSRLDFFVPELANIGMQEVLQQELYATKDNKDVVFGFQDRYQEYRYRAPKVTGGFRTSMLDYWNMARHFSAAPVINESFISMSNSQATFKRPFVEQTEHSYLAMIANHCIAYRPIPKRAKNILK